MIKIGMMIGDRYEILEKIGTGGMSDVYKAKCHKLNRYVAVKVLKQEFSENANFVSKFRIEAQAAASLMHPNIVNVYDVGEENGINYFVMELVEGINLKKYIEKKARLSFKEAVSIAIQVSMGIEAAHNNHIIHRDIKPQNIIISKEGKVKVTDFGIAKAATSNTITSNVMGSVHYTSPEQARGGYSDEKSDIYSMGITLFEMLTGRLPYNGETTVAIAIKHIQEPMLSPKEFIPEIPTSVEQIVLKCCQKSPDRRYQSMGELIEDLKQCLIHPDNDFVVMSNPDEEAQTRFISDMDMAQIKRQSEHRDYMDESMRLRTDADYDHDEDDQEEDYEEDYNPKIEKITTVLTVVAGIVICCVIIFFVGKIAGIFGSTKGKTPNETTEGTMLTEKQQVEMIVVAGMSAAEAQKELKGMGLLTELNFVESEAYEQNIIISSDITPGTKIDIGSTVTLTVSAGTEGREVPDVTGLSYEDAANKLAGKGFIANKSESYSPSVEKGNVISQSPESGQKAPVRSVITVNVSLGQEDNKVRVPNIMGVTEDEAVAKLIEAGLAVGSTSQVNSNDYEAGLVCYQSYSYGSYVEPGTTVDMKVSLGPDTVTYKYNASIEGPTVIEAPDYVAGTSVGVTIVADNGKVLMDTTTTSFPISANYYGIASPKGIITFNYSIITPSSTTTNEAGESVTVPGKTEVRTFTRPVEFVRE
ncbi:MAG TPA: Stk1 family PASTA domain-containing Ser/Thr kinase [Lachnospiraceae bacterium]|nr:Stk1 family PASTA domain-containing Ser/Thr kinase [Lachnospiraceae bacterium]